jgi:hypothetical protein
MALETAILIFGYMFDLGFDVLGYTCRVGKIIGHFDGVAHLQVIEHFRVLFDQNTHSFGGNVPQLELVKRIETFRGELDAVVPSIHRSHFRSSLRSAFVQMFRAHRIPRLRLRKK